MEQVALRTGKPDEVLRAAIGGADDSEGSLGHKLFGFDEVRNSDCVTALLRQAVTATDAEVAALAGAVVPALGEPIARAWQWLEKFPIAFPIWTIGDPAVAENRSIWLRELLRELARFELPPKRDDALLWLAIYNGSYAKEVDRGFAALVAEFLGGAHYQLGTTGCDHVGRLLASEIAQGNGVADDLLDTLRLVGICRHPALTPDKRYVSSPHVARGLAGCGREEAIEALCETITVDRGSTDLVVSAAIQATAAAVEVLTVFPNVLPSLLETIAVELADGKIDRESLAKQLAPVLALPGPLLADPGCDSVLRTCASALRDADRRQQMIASDDEIELFLGFWAEAAIDVNACGRQLLERYEQANSDQREDTKPLLRQFAKMREGRALAMRPLWLRMLAESLGDAPGQLNIAMVAEVLSFASASGLTTGNDYAVPADEALETLLEIEKRLRSESLKAELVKASSLESVHQVDSTLVKFVVANLAGRPANALLPFVARLDYKSFPLLADVDFAQADAKTRAAVIERANSSSPNGSKIMIRAVAAADSIDELVAYSLAHFKTYSVDPLFAIACALRDDRIGFWRQLILASKKNNRELGLMLVINALKVIDGTQRYDESKIRNTLPSEMAVDADAIRRDASKALDEYEATQGKRKNGDDLKAPIFRSARALSRTPEEAETKATEKRAALARLCDRVAEMTGINRERFTPTPPQPPRDRGSHFAAIFGEVAPKSIEAAAGLMAEYEAQSVDREEQKVRFIQWFANRGPDLREGDGSDGLRVHEWFWGPGNWSCFDDKVLKRAKSMMSPAQSKRIAELRPPALNVPRRELLREWFRSLEWEAKYDYQEILLTKLDWYESVLANLPESIQRLGPLAPHSAAPHPPHEQAIAHVYTTVCDWLRSRQVEPTHKVKVRERLWPLQWWTASFGVSVQSIDDSAVGTAVSSGQASPADLVWYLVQPGYDQSADNLVKAVKNPERLCPGMDTVRDSEIRAVIGAVADICRQQENAADPLLPATLVETWRRMPAPPAKAGLVDILRKYTHVAYLWVGRTDDQQKAFVARVYESLADVKKTWTVYQDEKRFDAHVDSDKVDAWRENMTRELATLLTEKVVSEDLLLRIGLAHPLLLRSVLDATGRSNQLEAVIWILAHKGSNLEDLAITLDAHTGHAGIRRSGLTTSQIGHRLVAHYAPGAAKQDGSSFWPASDATIRRSWKQSAIDAHPRKDLEPLLKALKAVTPAKDRLRVEGLLDAMDGKLNAPAQREQLESAIKDRPNLALLQLAAMPLPDDQEELVMEISRRLKIFEAMSIAGRKRKSADARESMRRALDQVRRTLADNAGLADAAQLDWLSGEAIAKELAEFERLEAGDYVIQLRLRGDGPQVLVTKSGKSLKSIPAAFKSSENGKRLTELQSRLKTSLRDTRSVLEESMIQQRPYLPDDLKMMMKHPVVAAVAGELVFVMEPKKSGERAAVGLPSDDGERLVGLDGKGLKVSRPVRVAHPLELEALGVLSLWKNWLTDHPPQPFQQVERTITRAADLETASEGKCVVRHDGVELKSEDQAFRILQAHGWQDDRELHELCRTFPSDRHGEITATLTDFMWHSNSIGTLEFRDSNWNAMSITDVPPVILSEAIRDVDRTVAGSSID